MASTAVHEFGHTFNVWHPPDGATAATMQTTGNANAGLGFPNLTWRKTLRRDLRYFDIYCSRLYGGSRVDNEYLYVSPNRQWIYQEQKYGPPYQYSSTEAFKTSWGDLTATSAASLDRNWLRYNGSAVSFDSLVAASAPKVVDWEEQQFDRRIYFGLSTDEGGGGWNSSHAIKVVGTSFVVYAPNLQQCTAMLNPYGCLGSASVYSARRVGSAFNEAISKTVLVWTRSDPASELDFRRVRLTAGRLDSETVPIGAYVGNVTSIVGPSIACKPDRAWGRDCVVAYVPHDSDEQWVNTTLLDVVFNGVSYDISSVASGSQKSMKTGSDITLWFQDDSNGGRFWMAVRSLDPLQTIQVWNSPGGWFWTYKFDVGPGLVGPDSVSYTRGTWNAIITNY